MMPMRIGVTSHLMSIRAHTVQDICSKSGTIPESINQCYGLPHTIEDTQAHPRIKGPHVLRFLPRDPPEDRLGKKIWHVIWHVRLDQGETGQVVEQGPPDHTCKHGHRRLLPTFSAAP